MVREQLYLTGAVEENVILTQFLKLVREPVHVILQLLERVKHPSVRAELVV
jgi:hypothetical protein